MHHRQWYTPTTLIVSRRSYFFTGKLGHPTAEERVEPTLRRRQTIVGHTLEIKRVGNRDFEARYECWKSKSLRHSYTAAYYRARTYLSTTYRAEPIAVFWPSDSRASMRNRPRGGSCSWVLWCPKCVVFGILTRGTGSAWGAGKRVCRD